MEKKCTILFVCGRERSYPRNVQVIASLREKFTVIPLTSDAASYGLRLPLLFVRLIIALIFRRFDLVYAGFLGQPFVPFIRLFSRRPVLFDAFVSVYDTLCTDRRILHESSLAARALFFLERLSFTRSTAVIADTAAHADFFSRLFTVARARFFVLYNSADATLFFPEKKGKKEPGFIVFFHGEFLPLHGVEYILRAAKKLEARRDIHVRMLGRGRRKERARLHAEEHGISNITFLDWISYDDLSERIAGSDVCLGGPFGLTPKAQRIITGKTFLYLAMRKPVIVGRTPATIELFRHKEHVFMCPRADGDLLCGALCELYENRTLREEIAHEGYRLFQSRCSLEAGSRVLREIVTTAIDRFSA